LGATSGAAVVPNPYRLQAGNADDTTSFENYPMFHTASLERPPRDGNGRFGAGNDDELALCPLDGWTWGLNAFFFGTAE
jgi:hypothetical protein